jgi:hypothetical protein
MTPFSRERKDGSVKDHCMLCSAPVYETETGVRFLGLWVRQSCYRRETESPDTDSPRPTDPAQ